MERPRIQLRGPVLNAPDVTALARFYDELLGWPVKEVYGPRPGEAPGEGWAQLRPADSSTKIEIQFDEHSVWLSPTSKERTSNVTAELEQANPGQARP